MEWINIHVSSLTSELFMRSDPVQRATWLCLLRYCVVQENGGTIKGVTSWPNRTWEQLCGVTKDEALAACLLWKIRGDDLIIMFYPVEQETLIKLKRSGGRSGAIKRWTNIAKVIVQPKVDSSPIATPTETLNAKRKGRVKEEKEKGKVSGVKDHAAAAREADSSWLETIKAQYAKIGVDTDVEKVKAEVWLSTRPSRKFTQRFFVNWLNKVERPVSGYQATKAASIQARKGELVREIHKDISAGISQWRSSEICGWVPDFDRCGLRTKCIEIHGPIAGRIYDEIVSDLEKGDPK